jgi:hypothetical protein
MKVLELKGYKSLRALNAFNALMLGLKMLPSYMGEEYETFLNRVNLMPPADQLKMIREAAMFVELQKEEVEAIICFAADKNGVPYGPENLKSLNPSQLIDIIVAVCFEIAQIKIDFVSETEKKNLEISPLM